MLLKYLVHGDTCRVWRLGYLSFYVLLFRYVAVPSIGELHRQKANCRLLLHWWRPVVILSCLLCSALPERKVHRVRKWPGPPRLRTPLPPPSPSYGWLNSIDDASPTRGNIAHIILYTLPGQGTLSKFRWVPWWTQTAFWWMEEESAPHSVNTRIGVTWQNWVEF